VSWIDDTLISLAAMRKADPINVWFVEVRSEWIGQSFGNGTTFRCLVCDQVFADSRQHRESHRADAERIRDEDLVPLNYSMRSELQSADLGFDDTVTIGDVRCIPRAFAELLCAGLRHKHLRWAFNRLWHDDDGFGDAVKAAGMIPFGVRPFIEQQYRED
jgi:hypothetical protein